MSGTQKNIWSQGEETLIICNPGARSSLRNDEPFQKFYVRQSYGAVSAIGHVIDSKIRISGF